LFNNCRALQAQSFVNPQAGSHAQDQVGPFAARAENEKHPETEGEGKMKELKAVHGDSSATGECLSKDPGAKPECQGKNVS
jgi:hypothetical protein